MELHITLSCYLGKKIGVNYMVYAENIEKNGHNPLSLHSECHLYKKYKNNPKIYNPKQEFDYLVIRYSKHGVLGESRPCFHCIKSIQSWTDLKIKNVYYSRSFNGEDYIIHREKINDMLDDNKEIHICNGIRRRRKRDGTPIY
jgi:hypothetical protein